MAVARKAGAGCTMVIKPSPETPLSVLTLAFLTEEAGYSKEVLNISTTSLDDTPSLSEALCCHPLAGKVTFAVSVCLIFS
jgi:acyl-CoA reductase-like NAD-dependent aldehyde dehydrogenase